MKDITLVFDPVFRTVDFAHGGGEIAGRAEVPEDIRQPTRIAPAQAVVAVVVGILPAEEGHAAGRTDRVLRDGIVKAAAFPRHPIQVRCQRIGMTSMPKDFGIVLVGDDEENVGGCHTMCGPEEMSLA